MTGGTKGRQARLNWLSAGFTAVIAALVAAIHVFVDPRDKPAGDGVEFDHHSKPQPGTDDEITFQRPVSAAG